MSTSSTSLLTPRVDNRVLHLYTLTLPDDAQVLFIIAIEPPKNPKEEHTLSLFSKAGKIERKVCRDIKLNISFDPRQANFEVCLIPRGESFPSNALYGLRVWLVKEGHQHRLFSDDHFWIAKNPEFNLHWLGSTLARPVSATVRKHLMEAWVGGAYMNFIVNVEPANPFEGNETLEYTISLHYERGGIIRPLSGPLHARITAPLSTLNFIIYTVLLKQTPTETIHRLFLWLRSTEADEGICQRLWKTDSFRVTCGLDVMAIPGVVVGKRVGGERQRPVESIRSVTPSVTSERRVTLNEDNAGSRVSLLRGAGRNSGEEDPEERLQSPGLPAYAAEGRSSPTTFPVEKGGEGSGWQDEGPNTENRSGTNDRFGLYRFGGIPNSGLRSPALPALPNE